MANLMGRGNSVPVMQGATSESRGYEGLVPAPLAGDENKVLSGAGTWVEQSGGKPDEYVKKAEVSEDGKKLTLTDQDGKAIEFAGGGGGGTPVEIRYDSGEENLTIKLV